MADVAPIIIVKKVKKGGHGSHGGAWKVAYADFVTAMMAFFLLLWLLNVATKEQKQGLSDYFAPTTASISQSGSDGVMGGKSMQTEGARISDTGVPSVVSSIQPPEEGKKDEGADAKAREMEEAELLAKLAEIEEASFEDAKQEIRQAISKDPELSGLNDNIIIDMTPEGLRIQIVDQFDESMFKSGSAEITQRSKALLGKIAKSIKALPNRLSISGHTDSSSYNGGNYSNWELSSDRANASRRAMIDAGLAADRISKVAGRADTEPLIVDDPSNPGNRRIAIVLLRETPVLPKNLK
ncbi:MAG: motility protein MotB [Sneathiella sp.]|nr:MAG: motility protein MotB [Sneathiella sp.]